MNPFIEIRDELIIETMGISNKFYSNTITILLFFAYTLFMTYAIIRITQCIKAKKKRNKEITDSEKKFIQSFKKIIKQVKI